MTPEKIIDSCNAFLSKPPANIENEDFRKLVAAVRDLAVHVAEGPQAAETITKTSGHDIGKSAKPKRDDID